MVVFFVCFFVFFKLLIGAFETNTIVFNSNWIWKRSFWESGSEQRLHSGSEHADLLFSPDRCSTNNLKTTQNPRNTGWNWTSRLHENITDGRKWCWNEEATQIISDPLMLRRRDITATLDLRHFPDDPQIPADVSVREASPPSQRGLADLGLWPQNM